MAQRRRSFAIPVALQTSIMFVFGLGLITYEVIRSGEGGNGARWEVLAVGLALIGLPIPFTTDLRRQQEERET